MSSLTRLLLCSTWSFSQELHSSKAEL